MTGRELRNRVLVLGDSTETAQVEHVLKALDSPNRLRILRYLSDRMASVNDIAAALDLPTSTAALHVETLEESGLIRSEFEPASRGLRKVSARMFDHPASFYEPERLDAQLLWFHKGYVEYRFPNRLPVGTHPESLRLSMEVCSQAPLFNLDWPSDITVWINGVEIGTWTSPGDFGGEPGRLTPEWWTPRNTQYGLLKVWHVNERETEVDGMRISGMTLRDLKLPNAPFIAVRVGVKADAEHVGGLNLFGSRFGNYPQDLLLRIGYRSTPRVVSG